MTQSKAREGNSIEPFEDHHALEAKLDDFARTRKGDVILEQKYLWANDEVGRAYTAALMEAAERGVQVVVLVDAKGTSDTETKNGREALARLRQIRDGKVSPMPEVLRALDQHPNGNVVLLNVPRTETDRVKMSMWRAHEKITAIIRKGERVRVYTGGHNVGNKYARGSDLVPAEQQAGTYHDVDARIEGPATQDFVDHVIWSIENPGYAIGELHSSNRLHAEKNLEVARTLRSMQSDLRSDGAAAYRKTENGNARIRVVVNKPRQDEYNIENMRVELLKTAPRGRRVRSMSPFHNPTRRLQRATRKAANKSELVIESLLQETPSDLVTLKQWLDKSGITLDSFLAATPIGRLLFPEKTAEHQRRAEEAPGGSDGKVFRLVGKAMRHRIPREVKRTHGGLRYYERTGGKFHAKLREYGDAGSVDPLRDILRELPPVLRDAVVEVFRNDPELKQLVRKSAAELGVEPEPGPEAGDGAIELGSANGDRLSLRINTEIAVLVEDRGFQQKIGKLMDRAFRTTAEDGGPRARPLDQAWQAERPLRRVVEGLGIRAALWPFL